MTAHSPVDMAPTAFHVHTADTNVGSFAHNDLRHEDPMGTDHELFSEGLAKSLYNYMHGVCLDYPLQRWFDHKVPETSLPPDLIARYLALPSGREIKSSQALIWIGGPVRWNPDQKSLEIQTQKERIQIKCSRETGLFLCDMLPNLYPSAQGSYTYQSLQEAYLAAGFDDFTLFWYGSTMESLKASGLLVL